MDLKHIKNVISKRKNKPLGIKSDFAVLLPLIYDNGKLSILYEVRAKHLDTQPGEISFPGGGVEKGETFLEAAIRETVEELNIKKDNIEIIGKLDYLISPFNFSIHPFVGVLNEVDKKNIMYNKDEVDNIFTVPIDFFINNKPTLYNMTLKPNLTDDFPYHLIPNGKDYDWRVGKYPVYFYKYRDYIIWGITARITKNFIDIIR
ncbi:NUDIX hydrolase [Thermohalobacter berrensis]|uniref:Coenzyme A pyrophosphatase n=1 Tax=Thermohalobacter berrensis TaxID=99594 RepID=A0A419SWH9_9FIRM|nr:CoA pyrophosphatase [Thermohalobacter berrensis]RKD29565.1 coenzyme A pyrophosphatase [Thermohalobacter berrensis]